jgi:predicted aspartyl protease
MLRVGDHPPVPVVFDTGTSGNILDRQIAKRFGLPNTGPSTAKDGSLGKPIAGFATVVKNASLGGVRIADGPANAIAYDLTDEVGIFGPGSFSGRLVRMDLAAGLVTVLPKTKDTIPAADAIPYTGKGDDALPSVILDFGGLKTVAVLDTGNNKALLLPLSLAAKLPLQAQPQQIGSAVSAGGQQPLYRAKLKGSVRIGPLVLDQPEVEFIAGGIPNVGLPVARQLVVVFDPADARSWIMGVASGSR